MTLPESFISELLFLITTLIGGASFIAAFLWLATFSRGDISTVVTNWVFLGSLVAIPYLMFMVGLGHKSSLVLLFLVGALGFLFAFLLRSIELTNKHFRRTPLFAIWSYIWVTFAIGWRYGWLGLLLITLPALLLTGAGLFYVAGYLLPFPEKTIEERRQALRCLVTFTLGSNYPYYVVHEERMRERMNGDGTWMLDEEKIIQRADGDAFGAFLSGPGIVLTPPDQAVVLSTGTTFRGAKGPGVVFTKPGDKPSQVIDLRVQLRAFPVDAWTKDGIAVTFTTFIPFQIGTGQEVPSLGESFPYRTSEVFKAVHAQRIEQVDASQKQSSKKPILWYDLPEIVGRRIMRDIISRYTFDELYAPFHLYEDPSKTPRARIGAELKEKLDKILPEWGIQRIGAGFGNVMPKDELAIDRRIEAWRAEWARKIMIEQAAGHSARLNLVEQSRAQAQVDIILNIGKRIEQLRVSGAPVPMDVVVRYFVEVLEELAGKPSLRKLLPRDTSEIIYRAHRVIDSDTETGEKGPSKRNNRTIGSKPPASEEEPGNA